MRESATPKCEPYKPEFFPMLSKTILVVDDEPELKQFVCMLLRKAEYQVLNASGCFQAQEIILAEGEQRVYNSEIRIWKLLLIHAVAFINAAQIVQHFKMMLIR